MGLGIQSALESQSCMWSSSALVSVSCVHEWKENKQTEKKKRSNGEKKKKTFNQTAAERKHNAVLFQKKPRMSWLRVPKLLFQEMETKLNLQNFFYKTMSSRHLAQALQSLLHLYAVGWTQPSAVVLIQSYTPFIISSPIRRQLSALIAPLS